MAILFYLQSVPTRSLYCSLVGYWLALWVMIRVWNVTVMVRVSKFLGLKPSVRVITVSVKHRVRPWGWGSSYTLN